MWGSGTAIVICPINGMTYDGKHHKIPIDEELKAGKLTNNLYQRLTDIQLGIIEHEFSVVIDDYLEKEEVQKEKKNHTEN